MFGVREYDRTLNVIKFSVRSTLLDYGCAPEDGLTAGGPGEHRFGVDPLRAAGDPVFYLLNVDLTDWS